MLMICPDKTDCACVGDTRHCEPHKLSKDCINHDCSNSDDINIACVPYEPKPTEPQGQLYMLPPKDTVENPFHSPEGKPNSDYWMRYGFKFGIDSVYSSAKPVDIGKLAERIAVDLDDVNTNIRVLKIHIKQAIEDYIKEVK